VPALPLGELGGAALKEALKVQLCGSESDERKLKKGMNMMKVNETRSCSL